MVKGAKVNDTHQLILRQWGTAVIMGRAEDMINLDSDPQFFVDLTVKGIIEAFPLVHTPGDAFPH